MTNNLYGEFDDNSYKPQQPQPQPPQEIRVVEVKSGNEIPFRWQVASRMMHAVVSNHEYSARISAALSKDGKSIDRNTFQTEVAKVSIGLADILIDTLNKTTEVVVKTEQK